MIRSYENAFKSVYNSLNYAKFLDEVRRSVIMS